jgi:hypothetical protein
MRAIKLRKCKKIQWGKGMINKSAVQDIILQALQNINEERSADSQLLINLEMKLFGMDAELDSLSLVSVIVDVESAISEVHGQYISLTDDRAMSQKISPFDDVGTLTDYILGLLAETS